MDGLTIGELAKTCGVHRETIRYYELHGLLPKPKRTASGYRMFGHDAVRRLQFIKRAQAAGFSLEEIKAMLDLKRDPSGTTGEVRAMVDVKIAEIDAKIRALESIRGLLVDLSAECPGGDYPASECPILASFEPDEAVPALPCH